jgi:cytochrome oxidase assembly protein ShyY1
VGRVKTGMLVVALIIAIAFSFGCWKFERWINWKFDYGQRVEERIDALEKRIEALENR